MIPETVEDITKDWMELKRGIDRRTVYRDSPERRSINERITKLDTEIDGIINSNKTYKEKKDEIKMIDKRMKKKCVDISTRIFAWLVIMFMVVLISYTGLIIF